jgi:hypothetical protein
MEEANAIRSYNNLLIQNKDVLCNPQNPDPRQEAINIV